MAALARLLIAHRLPALCCFFEFLFSRTKGFLKTEKAIGRADLFKKLSEKEIHAVIIDDKLDGNETGTLINKIKLEYMHCKIIILASCLQPEYIAGLMHTQAEGYIYEGTNEKSIKKGIFEVLEGNKHLCPAITAVVTSGNIPVPDKNIIEKKLELTDKEKCVYTMKVQQKSLDEISTAMGIAMSTTKQHSASVLQKVVHAGFINETDCYLKTGYLPKVDIVKKSEKRGDNEDKGK